jgi:signal-transduction protein with cAMP-binding, CBS, and nucleotidyltransferase domain
LKLLEEMIETTTNEIEHLNWKAGELIKKINIAESYSELRDIHGELNEIQKVIFEMQPSVIDLHRLCTEYRDKISKKLINMVIRELITQNIYLPDESFAYIALGSDGRKEQTLITDQDNLIVYEDSSSRYKDFFYEKFSNLLVERLDYCGFKKCTGEIMPSNPKWRGTYSQWISRVERLCSFTSDDFQKNLVNLIVLTDLRFIFGDEELGEKFINTVMNIIYENHIVLNEIAKSAASLNVAKGFMRSFRVEKKGKYKGFINMKLNAWAPMILAIRAFAIKNKVIGTGTIERINELVKVGSFNKEDGELYKKAYYTLARFKVMCQIHYINGKYEDANYLNPNDLTKKEQEDLLDAMALVEKLQKLLINSMGLRL